MPLGPRSRYRPSRKISFICGKWHFYAVAFPFRLFERWRVRRNVGDISRALMYASRNLARQVCWGNTLDHGLSHAVREKLAQRLDIDDSCRLQIN